MSVKIEAKNFGETVEYFRSITNRPHLDSDMYKVEIALNLHGVGTCFSCKGHPDSLPAFPYILVCLQLPVLKLLTQYVEVLETQILSPQATEVENTIKDALSELGQNLCSLLSRFYSRDRGVPLPCRLVIVGRGMSGFMLVNQGGIVGLGSGESLLYVNEFIEFGEFLVSLFEKGKETHEIEDC